MSVPSLRADPFRLLGDDVRLRLLRIVASEGLAVSELTRILGVAQSGVSRHVRLLREGGFLAEERVSGWTRLRLSLEAPEGLGASWPSLRVHLAGAEDEHGDDARLAEVLRERSEATEGWGSDSRRPPEPGRSWVAWSRALGHLLPAPRVADLGCGEGALTLEIARWAGSVTGFDPSRAALERAREVEPPSAAAPIAWVASPLDALPCADAAFDFVVLSQLLHDYEDPRPVLREALRVLAPGGRALVMDLMPHDEAWVRERHGHRRLGFAGEEVVAFLGEAGFVDTRWEKAARRRGNPFVVLVASARRPPGGEEDAP